MQAFGIRAAVTLSAVAALAIGAPAAMLAQAASAAPAAPVHPKVCAEGVKEYSSRSEILTPFDTLEMPPGEPIRVTSPEEAEAAQRAIRARAGSVGATGLIVEEVREDDGMGMVQLHRNVKAVFVPADAARAYAACRSKEKD